MSKTKIVVCTTSFAPSINGMSTVSQEISAGLADNEYEVHVITPEKRNGNIENIECKIKVSKIIASGRGIIGDKYKWDGGRYHDILRSSNADVFLFIGWENYMIDMAFPIFRELNGKKILASHGTSVYWRPPGIKGWARRFCWIPFMQRYRKQIGEIDYFILLTRMAQRERFYDKILLEKRGAKNWTVIPNGTRCELIEKKETKFRNIFNISTQLLILYVSNYNCAKNQEELVDIFGKSGIKDASLVFIGDRVNDYFYKLMARVSRYPRLAKNILLLHSLSKEMLREAYCSADIFACTSITEAQPLVILDAMAYGIPFISTNVGCIKELRGGVIANNRKEYALLLKKLCNNETIRYKLGQEGREECREKYNWDLSIKKYSALIQYVIKEI